jgi:hypothetical protein
MNLTSLFDSVCSLFIPFLLDYGSIFRDLALNGTSIVYTSTIKCKVSENISPTKEE